MTSPSRAQPLGPTQLLLPSSPFWPAAFCDLADPPAQLELAGNLPAGSPAVAIVGTRKPDPRAGQLARSLARELGEAGWVVVSGGAIGIDTEAHRGALEAGARTVAVLGTPVQRPYPAANLPLFRQIVASGCVLSELKLDDPVYQSRFLERNRLIAALAQVVVVVQAPIRSGALSTAAEAKLLKRTVLGVPFAPWEARGEGCLALLAGGAGICRDSRDVLSLSAAGSDTEPAKPRSRRSRRPDKSKEFQWLGEDERAVLGAFKGLPMAADELCEATGLPAQRVQRAILMLLLSMVIQEVGSGRYLRRDCR